MKRYIVIALSAALLLASCTRLDEIQTKLDEMEQRLESVEEYCSDLNREILALQDLINALQEREHIVSVSPISENGEIIGQTIRFSGGASVSVYTRDRQSAAAPFISVGQGEDGRWYWTKDGVWMTDNTGSRIPVSGQDGVTPRLKVSESRWFISYDQGNHWSELEGVPGGAVFVSVDSSSPDHVVFTLADGSSFAVPKHRGLSIEISETDGVGVSPGTSRRLPYTISGASENVQIEAIAEGAQSLVIPKDKFTGEIQITAGATLAENARVLVFVADGETVILRKITLEQSSIQIQEAAARQVPYSGGEITIDILTNTEIEIEIPDNAASWITLVPDTKSHLLSRKLSVAANEGAERTATLTVRDKHSSLHEELTVLQPAGPQAYVSTDYSKNGTFKVLQTAEGGGQGINIVFLGDAYSDRLIADGTYDNDMKQAMEHYFEIEPYASLRSYFNCYQVYAVSQKEIYEPEVPSFFHIRLGDKNVSEYSKDKIYQYAQRVDGLLDNAKPSGSPTQVDGEPYQFYNMIPGGLLVIVVLNTSRPASRSWMGYNGTSISMCSKQQNDEVFQRVIWHEAGGHGFGRLAEETFLTYLTLSDSRAEALAKAKSYGLYQNVDTTDDADKICWSALLGIPAYSGEVGIIEGGWLTTRGVWRSSESSIMRDNTGRFNAVGREIIFRRVMTLRHGNTYEYNLSDFLSYDAKNLQDAQATKAAVSVLGPPIPRCDPDFGLR